MKDDEPLPAEGGAVQQRRLGPVGDLIGFHLRLAQDVTYQAFVAQASRQRGMRFVAPGYSTILALIGENPGITQTALSRVSARDKSTLTPILNEFAENGFITRTRLDSDRRSFAISLTPKGRSVSRELLEVAYDIDRQIEAAVGPAGRDEFIQTLRAIRQAFERGAAVT